MKKILLLNIFLCGICIAHAVPNDTVSVRLCREAENAYTGANGSFLNKEKAFQLYAQAAERKYIPAIHKVAGFYYRGEVVEKSPKDYLAWLLKAAELGDADAQNKVGVCFHDGNGTVQNTEKAIYWYVKAANQGNVHAMDNLRILYDNQKNKEEALKWARMGAEHGHVDCQYYMGNAYNNGNGLKEDIDQAVYWYKLAADNGHKDAYNKLGVIYHNVKKEYEQSFTYTSKAVELGSEYAYFNLGFDYEYGDGIGQDFVKAEYYYLKAIEKESGNINSARYRLGIIYYEGREGVKKDKKKGQKLLEDAARNGNKEAEKYLDEHKVKWSVTINGEKIK